MENIAERILKAIVAGLIVGIIVALVCVLLNALLPLDVDPSFWATVTGVLTALYVFVTRKSLSI